MACAFAPSLFFPNRFVPFAITAPKFGGYRKSITGTQMKLEKLLIEIRETNLAYLTLAKKMIIEDKAEAICRLGIREEIADIISSLSSAQILKMASSNFLFCRFSFDDQIILELVASHSKDLNLNNLHSSVMVGNQTAELL